MSDEDDRVDFTINVAERERQRMKDTFLAVEHGSEDDSDHDRDWEEQQIRKVVGTQQAVSVNNQVCQLLAVNT